MSTFRFLKFDTFTVSLMNILKCVVTENVLLILNLVNVSTHSVFIGLLNFSMTLFFTILLEWIYLTPLPRISWNTKSIFKWIKAGSNLVFLLLDLLPNLTKKLTYSRWGENQWIHAFSKVISKLSLVQDLNSSRWFHFLWPQNLR